MNYVNTLSSFDGEEEKEMEFVCMHVCILRIGKSNFDGEDRNSGS